MWTAGIKENTYRSVIQTTVSTILDVKYVLLFFVGKYYTESVINTTVPVCVIIQVSRKANRKIFTSEKVK